MLGTLAVLLVVLVFLLRRPSWRVVPRRYRWLHDAAQESKGLAPSISMYVFMILLGLFLPVVAVLGYLLVALYIIVPLGAIRLRSSQAWLEIPVPLLRPVGVRATGEGQQAPACNHQSHSQADGHRGHAESNY